MEEMICPWCKEGDHARCTARPPCRCQDPSHRPSEPDATPTTLSIVTAVGYDPAGTGALALAYT